MNEKDMIIKQIFTIRASIAKRKRQATHAMMEGSANYASYIRSVIQVDEDRIEKLNDQLQNWK